MLEKSKKAATKFGIDMVLIEKKTDTQKNIEILGDDLTFLCNAFIKIIQGDARKIKSFEENFIWN